MSLKVDSRDKAQEIIDKYDYFLFDCDGVIWRGDHILPKVAETLDLLKKNNKTVLFVTNNSTKSRDDYLGKFEKIGISGITKDEVFGSSYASAVYIEKILQLPKDKKVWVLGEAGIEKELQELGYTTIGGTDPRLTADGVTFDPDHELLNNLDKDVGAVIVGLTMNLNYLKLSITMQYLIKDNKSIPFIATNIDSTFPTKDKLLIGAGSIIESVSYASGRKPDAVCGKPNQSMLNAIKADNEGLKASPGKGLMVGDRLNTDMKFGRDGGLDTLLVLTGIETEDRVLAQEKSVAPTYYADKLGDLFEMTQ
ncbi:p-nitrophenyl phosphatase [Suhomyces tanzawaensis NRRL Y-17324]|uniref:4-nitrophenylphosphatase n=1 Tax=Suhomyces tanzawaensis NRRL Y-17324 TaxID=984487 RepID=A0A1E4SAZ9_9ASCO|nr:p-nitrophenyl phosphatase [Suhomyces tanzawaensis NRRL Y-17324]ODV76684.1 p-nitrophenyl phosphatase [Suhomyces tanzawaensis NRRL Y-17324]